MFPFGFGLSYTTISYSDLVVAPQTVGPGGDVRVSLRVANTGERAGTATPQVYLGFPAGAGEPPHRLVATAKVTLKPGEAKRVSMTVSPQSFAYWDEAAHNWDVAPGDYTLDVGSSSATCRCT